MLVISLALNIYVTLLIAGRLFAYRHRFKANWGSPHTKHYTSMGTMLVESYLVLALCTVAFVVVYSLDSLVQYMMAAILSQVQIIAPLMVMIRVSRGIAWEATVPGSLAASVEDAVDRALQAHDARISQLVVSPS